MSFSQDEADYWNGFKSLVLEVFPDFNFQRTGLAVRMDLNQRLGTNNIGSGSLSNFINAFRPHLLNALKEKRIKK